MSGFGGSGLDANSRIAGYVIGAGLLMGVAVWGAMYMSQAPVPIVSSDNLGSTLGGRSFVITGDHFMVYGGKTRVLVDGNEAPNVSVVSAHSIIARAPKGSDGAKDVIVINPNGKRSKPLANGYVYSKYKPDIEKITPDVLPAAGGVPVTITGTGFTQVPIYVRFHTSNIPFTIVNDTTITFIAPPAPHKVPTSANVEVDTKDGKWQSDEYGVVYR